MRIGAWVCAFAFSFAVGCSHQPRLLLPSPPRADEVGAVLRGTRLTPGEGIRVTPLSRSEHMSMSLVQISDREQPHVHTRYDVSVLLVRGRGTLYLDGQPLPLGEGDAAFVPKGTPHFFVNQGSEPAAALVTFAPPFDAPDQQPPSE